jgi:hypothetical protein
MLPGRPSPLPWGTSVVILVVLAAEEEAEEL